MRECRIQWWQAIWQTICMVVALVISAMITLLEVFVCKEPEPYHTSTLTGRAWVLELLAGHPDHICCELSMHKYVFYSLITQLWAYDHTDSRFISLEEQLAIFLYSCVTGLTIWHVGEWFQRSNDTISRWVWFYPITTTLMNFLDIFRKCYIFSQPHHSIWHMYAYLQLTIHPHPESKVLAIFQGHNWGTQ
jgi:hypothetical protein